MNRHKLAGYLSTLGINKHPEKFLPIAVYVEAEIKKADQAGYERGYERGFAQAETWLEENKKLKEQIKKFKRDLKEQ